VPYRSGTSTFSERRRTRQEVESLEDEPDLPVPDRRQGIVVEARDVAAGQAIRTRGRRVETAEDVHERRLARAGRPDDRDELALGDIDADAAQRADGHLADLVGLDEVADLDERRQFVARGFAAAVFFPAKL
jgi:hypothetical protein